MRLFPEQPEGGQELPSERDANYGRYLDFYSGGVYPLHGAYRGHGMSVRSAEEKIIIGVASVMSGTLLVRL